MEIRQETDGGVLTTALAGRMDTNTSSQLEAALAGKLNGVETLRLDLTHLAYISSAGLRVLLSLHKQCGAANARMVVANCTPVVRDILDMTGFSSLLNFE